MAGIIVIILMYYYKKIDKKQLLIFFIAVAFMFILHSFIKNNVQSHLWLNSNGALPNDFSSQKGKLLEILQLKGFITMLKVGIGHVFYVGAATFLIAYLGILFLLKQILVNIKEKNYAKETSTNIYGMLFLILSFIFSLIINVIFMSDPTRIDNLIYGRYIENVLGPIIFIGLGYSFSEKKNIIKASIVCIIVFIFTAIVTYYSLNTLNLQLFSSQCSIGIWLFYKNGTISIFTVSCFTMIIYIIIGLLLYASAVKKTYGYMALSIIILVFVFTGKELIDNQIVEAGKQNMGIMNIVHYIQEHNKAKVYFILENNFANDSTKDYFQFLMDKRILTCITEDQINRLKGNYLIITATKNPFSDGLAKKYKIEEGAVGGYNLWKLKGNNDNNNTIELKMDELQSQVGATDLIQNQIISNGKAGCLTYGPYMELGKGKYNFQVSYHINKNEAKIEDMGYLELASGETQFNKSGINREGFDFNGNLKINIPVNLQSDTQNIEIRTYVNEGIFMNVKSVKIYKLN
jgi:hypothetical protein